MDVLGLWLATSATRTLLHEVGIATSETEAAQTASIHHQTSLPVRVSSLWSGLPRNAAP